MICAFGWAREIDALSRSRKSDRLESSYLFTLGSSHFSSLKNPRLVIDWKQTNMNLFWRDFSHKCRTIGMVLGQFVAIETHLSIIIILTSDGSYWYCYCFPANNTIQSRALCRASNNSHNATTTTTETPSFDSNYMNARGTFPLDNLLFFSTRSVYQIIIKTCICFVPYLHPWPERTSFVEFNNKTWALFWSIKWLSVRCINEMNGEWRMPASDLNKCAQFNSRFGWQLHGSSHAFHHRIHYNSQQFISMKSILGFRKMKRDRDFRVYTRTVLTGI